MRGDIPAVAHAHESVSAVSQIHLLNQSDRNLAPDIRQLGEEICLVQPPRLVGLHGNDDRFFRFRRIRCQLAFSAARTWPGRVRSRLQVQTIEGEEVCPVRPVTAAPSE